MLVPSVDLMGGKAVQLRRGNPNDCALTVDDPVALAEQFARYGEVAVIDLDAALGRGDNLATIERILAKVEARVGGGIRDHARADRLLRAGARKLIIGTAATPEFLHRYPREAVIIAVDQKGGKVTTHGWTEGAAETAVERCRRMEKHCSEFLFTVVDREGMQQGTDLQAIEAVVKATENHVTAAGGITTVADVQAIDRLGASSQLGMAVYTGRLDLAEAYAALLDWTKVQGLLPVVVQDDSQVLMQAWVDEAGLLETLRTGKATYFSRSRHARWQKGETSGHTQRVRTVRYDCDRDALLYHVDQTGPACHTGQQSCFGPEHFDLHHLERILAERRDQPEPGSYTAKLFADPAFLRSKILEEAQELTEAPTDRDTVWEAADVMYFTMALLASKGLTLDQVQRELRGRHGRRRG